ncbi:ImpA domain protein [compost metagenome]
MVYDITRSFNRAVPVEEQLRQLAQTPQGQPLPAAQQSQTEMSLNALLNLYALTVTRPARDNVSP